MMPKTNGVIKFGWVQACWNLSLKFSSLNIFIVVQELRIYHRELLSKHFSQDLLWFTYLQVTLDFLSSKSASKPVSYEIRKHTRESSYNVSVGGVLLLTPVDRLNSLSYHLNPLVVRLKNRGCSNSELRISVPYWKHSSLCETTVSDRSHQAKTKVKFNRAPNWNSNHEGL